MKKLLSIVRHPAFSALGMMALALLVLSLSTEGKRFAAQDKSWREEDENNHHRRGSLQKTDRIFDVRRFGAVGDGNTNDTSALQAAMNACHAAGGGTVLIPPTPDGYVIGRNEPNSQRGGIRGYPGCSLIGHNTRLILRGNASYILYDPSLLGQTLTATVTADVSPGTDLLTVDNSAGFAPGDEVYFRLGQNPTDRPETQYFGWAKVAAVPGKTQLKLDRALNYALNVASTVPEDRVVQKFSVPAISNIEIGGFDLYTDRAHGGNAEEGVYVRFGRGLRIHDIQASDPGAGAVALQYVQDSEITNLRVSSSYLFGQSSKGRVISCGECRNVTFENIEAKNFDNTLAFVESYSQHVVFNNVTVTNTGNSIPHSVFTVVQGCDDVLINNLTVNGKAPKELEDNGGTTGRATLQNVTINTQDHLNINRLTGSRMKGPLMIRSGTAAAEFEGSYTAAQKWTGRLPLATNVINKLDLPNGIYKSVQIYASDTRGLKSAYVTVPSNHNSADFHAALKPNSTVEITTPGVVGFYAGVGPNATDLTHKQLTVYTSGDVTSGSYLTIDIEYYSKDGVGAGTPGTCIHQSKTPSGQLQNASCESSAPLN